MVKDIGLVDHLARIISADPDVFLEYVDPDVSQFEPFLDEIADAYQSWIDGHDYSVITRRAAVEVVARNIGDHRVGFYAYFDPYDDHSALAIGDNVFVNMRRATGQSIVYNIAHELTHIVDERSIVARHHAHTQQQKATALRRRGLSLGLGDEEIDSLRQSLFAAVALPPRTPEQMHRLVKRHIIEIWDAHSAAHRQQRPLADAIQVYVAFGDTAYVLLFYYDEANTVMPERRGNVLILPCNTAHYEADECVQILVLAILDIDWWYNYHSSRREYNAYSNEILVILSRVAHDLEESYPEGLPDFFRQVDNWLDDYTLTPPLIPELKTYSNLRKDWLRHGELDKMFREKVRNHLGVLRGRYGTVAA